MKGLPLTTRIAGELERRIRKMDIKEHRLRQLFWECTLSCNLSCRHCGSDCKMLPQASSEMKLDTFLKVLDSVKADCDKRGYSTGEILVIISGGEPLMRKDLEQCGRAIIKKGFPWGMVTNGYAMTRERFTALRKAGLHSMTVSLDGLKESHDWMRGRSGSFEKAIETIKLAVETFEKEGSANEPVIGVGEIAFDVVTCVNMRNFQELKQIKELLISLGVRQWRLFTIFPSGRAAQDPTLQLDNSHFKALLEFIAATRKEGRIKASYGCEGFLGEWEGKVRDNFYRCGAGISVGSVLADGSISACTSIRADFNQGNIYRDDFMQVWNNAFKPYRDREWMRKDECGSCSFFRYCEGNGMHLRNSDGSLKFCHLQRLK